MQLDIDDAKAKLLELVELAMLGEEVVIANEGKPMVKLVRVDPPKRKIGGAAGQIKFNEGWDDPMTSEELDEFLK